MRIPVATYRVQFNEDFRFQDATAIVPHLHRLGISHLYASPIFAARSGSTHGYDVVDPNRLNPELGTPRISRRWCGHCMIEAWGCCSISFRITWPPARKTAGGWMCSRTAPHRRMPRTSVSTGARTAAAEQDKIFLPILGDPYGRVLEKGELKLTL